MTNEVMANTNIDTIGNSFITNLDNKYSINAEKFTQQTINAVLNNLSEEQLLNTTSEYSVVIKSKKKTQVKMSRDFAEAFANRHADFNRCTLFHILYNLTPFIDLDMSIKVDLNDFRKFINMRSDTFTKSIDELQELQLLLYKNGQFFATNRTHGQVDAIYKGQEDTLKYVQNIPFLQDWGFVNSVLTKNEYRFLIYTLAYTSGLRNSHHTWMTNVKRFYEVGGNGYKNKVRTNIYNFNDLFVALSKYSLNSLVTFKLKHKAIGFTWESNAKYQSVEQYLNAFEQAVESVLVEHKLDRETFLNELFVNINGIYRKNIVNNCSSAVQVEGLLRPYYPFKAERLTDTPIIRQLFVNTEGDYIQEENPLNLMVNLKKELAAVLDSPAVAVRIYNEALEQFIEKYHSGFAGYAATGNLYSMFKDFYFMPRVRKLFVDAFKMVAIEVNNHLPTLLIDTGTSSINEIIVPRYNMILNREQYENLAMFMAVYGNLHSSVLTYDEISTFLYDISEGSTEIDYRVERIFARMTELFPKLNVFIQKYKSDVEYKYRELVMNHNYNIDIRSFAEMLPRLIRTTGTCTNEILLELIKTVQKQFEHRTNNVQVEAVVATYTNEIITRAQKLPLRLMQEAVAKGVSAEFMTAVQPHINEYVKNLSWSVDEIEINGTLTKKFTIDEEMITHAQDKLVTAVNDLVSVYSIERFEMSSNPATEFLSYTDKRYMRKSSVLYGIVQPRYLKTDQTTLY
ncbi:hypothetical protein [Solibacillus sp. NPDC093137]|uniref:hypothetical protein n=1 Tax=Solibacillus sp. NPDC093137 TaxID=3390678 RepID=UPI003D01C431